MYRQIRGKIEGFRNHLLGTVEHVNTTRPLVALSFDDGPHPEFTPQVLAVLERHNAYATFFVRGEKAVKHAELLRQMINAGHEVGNHSWSHPSFPLITYHAVNREIRACENVLPSHGPRLFRFPFGHQTVIQHLNVVLLGYKVIGWSLSGNDWNGSSAAEIAETIRSSLQPGHIVLLHDDLYLPIKSRNPEFADRKPTIQALDLILNEFSGSFKFVTVSHLMNCGSPEYHRKFTRSSRGPIYGK